MSESRLVDVTGRLRSPAATPGHWAGCAPPNKGARYPTDPPAVEEIILVMRPIPTIPFSCAQRPPARNRDGDSGGARQRQPGRALQSLPANRARTSAKARGRRVITVSSGGLS